MSGLKIAVLGDQGDLDKLRSGFAGTFGLIPGVSFTYTTDINDITSAMANFSMVMITYRSDDRRAQALQTLEATCQKLGSWAGRIATFMWSK